MADPVKPMVVHRDHYLDARLPEFQSAEAGHLVLFEPIARVVEIYDPRIAQRMNDYLVNYAPRAL